MTDGVTELLCIIFASILCANRGLHRIYLVLRSSPWSSFTILLSLFWISALINDSALIRPFRSSKSSAYLAIISSYSATRNLRAAILSLFFVTLASISITWSVFNYSMRSKSSLVWDLNKSPAISMPLISFFWLRITDWSISVSVTSFLVFFYGVNSTWEFWWLHVKIIASCSISARDKVVISLSLRAKCSFISSL